MATQSKTAGKIKTQIARFSNRLSSGLNKRKRKFLHQMIYGIQAGKDIKLANIGRSLREEIPLKFKNRQSKSLPYRTLRSALQTTGRSSSLTIVEGENIPPQRLLRSLLALRIQNLQSGLVKVADIRLLQGKSPIGV